MRLSTIFLLSAAAVMSEEATRTIEKTLSLGGNGRTVAICTISGSINVTGGSGNDVRITVRERLRANSSQALEELKRDVDVTFNQDSSQVQAGIRGPWSDGDCHSQNRGRDNNDRRRRWKGEDIHVSHDFTVTVPRDARLEIKSVNGSVSVKDSMGDYALSTVNGGVELIDMEGSGSAKTINGSVKAVYRRNPKNNTSFSTINGKLDLYFDPVLNADFTLKSLNGKAYTDFDMTALATEVKVGEGREGTKIVHRRDMRASLRAGSGGPKISTETLNGDILIHSTAKGRP